MAMRSVYALQALILIGGGCNHPPPDAEQLQREAFIAHYIEQIEAGARYGLVTRSQLEFHDGWSAPEVDLQTGRAFRWGGRHAVLRFKRNVTPKQGAGGVDVLTMRGFTPPMLGGTQEVRVLFKEREVARHELRGPFEIQIEIPQTNDEWVATKFDIALECRDVGVTWNDPRKFGLAIESVRLRSWDP
jgi:hypothetical protein